MAETEEYWSVLVANEEGVSKLVEFANSSKGSVIRSKLKPSIIAGEDQQPQQREIVVESLRDSEQKKIKAVEESGNSVVTEGNSQFVAMMDTAAMQGNSMSAKEPPSGLFMRAGIFLGSAISVMKAVQSEKNLLWFTLTEHLGDSVIVPITTNSRKCFSD